MLFPSSSSCPTTETGRSLVTGDETIIYIVNTMAIRSPYSWLFDITTSIPTKEWEEDEQQHPCQVLRGALVDGGLRGALVDGVLVQLRLRGGRLIEQRSCGWGAAHLSLCSRRQLGGASVVL